jgi:hypothetical protein
MSQPLLESGQEYMRDDDTDTLQQLTERLDSVEARFLELESAQSTIKRDAVVTVLSLLTESLRHIASGKMDIPAAVQSVATSGGQDKWAAIKVRNPGKVAEAIDVLLIHGTMNTKQLSAALKMGYDNCRVNVVGKLSRQGLIVKRGRDLSLKQL